MNAAATTWDVFISYSAKDFDIIQQIVRDLQERGISYWLDKEQINPGDLVLEAIEQGLRDSRAIMPCFSRNQLQSGWSKAEYSAILNRVLSGKTAQKIYPLLLDDVTEDNLPLFFRNIQCTRYGDTNNYTRFLDDLEKQQATVESQHTQPQSGDSKRHLSSEHIGEPEGQNMSLVLHQKIVDFLVSLPNIYDINTQRALIYDAGLDTQLLHQISFAGPPAQFFQLLVPTLRSYGTLEDGRNALEAVLEAAKKYVGKNKREYCDTLILELRTLFNAGESHPQDKDSIGSKPGNDKKFQDFSQIRQTVQDLYQQWNEGTVGENELTEGVRKALNIIITQVKAGERSMPRKQLMDMQDIDSSLILQVKRLEEARKKARRTGLREDKEEVEKRERLWLNIIQEAREVIEPFSV